MNNCDECKDNFLPCNKVKRVFKWRFKVIQILPVFVISLFQAWAQNAYAVQANIIYRFTKYINFNKTNIESRSLDIASELLNLGIAVR